MGALLALGCIGLILYVVVASVIRGFVLSYLWLWFAVPLGLPSIGIVHAIGISMLVGLLTADVNSPDSNSTADKGELIGKMAGIAVAPLIVLVFGYIVQSFM